MACLAIVPFAAPLTAQPTTSATTPATTQPAAAADPLSAIAWAIGEWRLDAKWANGNPIKARATYALGPGGRFVVATTHVDDGAGGESQRDVVVYGVQDGRLTRWTFAHDGTARVVPATPTDDGSLFFEWTKTDAAGKATELRQRLTRVADDRLRWQAFMQIRGEWHTLIDGEWRRAAK